jgi:hypothetical protein
VIIGQSQASRNDNNDGAARRIAKWALWEPDAVQAWDNTATITVTKISLMRIALLQMSKINWHKGLPVPQQKNAFNPDVWKLVFND